MINQFGAYMLLLTGLLSSSAAANQKEKTMSNEQNKVLTAIQSMTSAFHEKDMDKVLSSYENRAAVMFEPGVAITEPTEIRQMFDNAFQLNPQFEYPHGHEVYVVDDLALHMAPWVMRGQAPDGTQIEQTGLSVAVLRKQADGQWLLVLDNPHGQLLLGHD